MKLHIILSLQNNNSNISVDDVYLDFYITVELYKNSLNVV